MSAPLSIPSPSYDWQVLVDIGQFLRDIGLTWFPWNIEVRTYAVCILIGMIAAGIMTNRRLSRRGAEPGVVLDVAIWAVLFGIAGARAYHVLTHPNDYFFEGADPLAVFRVWDGGIAIFGSLLGGALGAWIGCRITGLRFWSFADALAPGLLLAQAFGRFGNWFNHELYGVPTDLPWGLEIESTNSAFPAGLPDGTLFHPTFLYEVIWNVLGVVVLLAIERHRGRVSTTVPGITPSQPAGAYRFQWGRLFGVYLIWYGLGRIVWETIRIDPSEIFLGVRVNVWAAILAVVVGLAIIVVQGRRHPGAEPSPYQPGREWTPTAGVDSDENFSDVDEADDDDESSDAAEVPAPARATSGAGAKA